MRRLLAACLFLLIPAALLSACGDSKGDASPDASPTSYLSHHGLVTPLREALRGVGFRPFIPAREIIETALLPPYNGGADTRENRGIGFEYVSRHEAYVLSEWPGPGQSGPYDLGTIGDCQLTGYDIAGGSTGKRGALWSNGTISSNLVPAGNASDHDTFEEARRLVRLGACR